MKGEGGERSIIRRGGERKKERREDKHNMSVGR